MSRPRQSPAGPAPAPPPALTDYLSRFRPWLDHPGDWPGVWPDWQLSREEAAAFAGAQQAGAATAAERLTNLYGEQAEVAGALALVETLSAGPLPPPDLQAAVLAIAAADYHNARVPLPQRRAGGSPDRLDGDLWQQLRPYLVSRGLALLHANLAEALLWRAVYGGIADNWAPQAQLTRALQQELSASGLFGAVEVTLELNPPVAGGGRWVAMQTKGALAELRRRLQRREACLLELIRDAEADIPAVSLVVAYGLEDELTFGRDGVDRVRLRVYDPRRGPEAVSLRLTLSDDRVQSVETPAARERPSVKAVRLVSLDPAMPPLFGWRRRLRHFLPWRFFWWVKRLWLLHVVGWGGEERKRG